MTLQGHRVVSVSGYPLVVATEESLAQTIQEWMRDGDGKWIVTLNMEAFSRAKKDSDFRGLISNADVFTADGMPLVWACKKLDPSLADMTRCTGADLTPMLLKQVTPKQIAIIGGKDPKAALQTLGIPGEEVFIYDGRVDVSEDFARNLAVRMGDRRLVFVALGFPKQERLIQLLRPLMPAATFIGVGGTFEMIAGITGRAPVWMQRAGFEWLYRLAIEPKRLWRRYLVEYPPGVMALWREVRARK